nr:MAG TPA: hypothetical protein [Caudoviricetes sp.]
MMKIGPIITMLLDTKFLILKILLLLLKIVY